MAANSRFVDYFRPDVNVTTMKSVYPTSGGNTSGSVAGAMTNGTNFGSASDASAAPDPGGSTSFTTSGKSLGWWLGIALMLIVLVFSARKIGSEEDFRNIKPTIYNGLVITLTAIVGIVGLKVILSKYRIPGFSDIVLAT